MGSLPNINAACKATEQKKERDGECGEAERVKIGDTVLKALQFTLAPKCSAGSISFEAYPPPDPRRAKCVCVHQISDTHS